MGRTIALLATSGLVPLVALSAVFGAATLTGQRRTMEDQAHAHAAFAATLISNRLVDEERQVSMVAQSPALAAKLDGARFRELAVRLLQIEPGWQTLSVASADGERLLDVPVGIGGRQNGRVVDIDSLRAAVAQHRTTVGQVVQGPRGGLAFAVRAPVSRASQVAYVVSAVVPSAALGALLRFEALPPGWSSVLVDGAGRIIASANPQALSVGRTVSGTALHARAAGVASPYRFTRINGTDAEAVFSRVAGTDWSVHVSAPASVFAGPLRRALLLVAGSTIICLLLFFAVARLLLAELRQNRLKEAAAGQAQRMEARGQLTGGVAHDLNNLLTPILGGLELLRRSSGEPRSVRYIDMAYGSAERARTLVGRLLAFSRRQPLQPKDVEVSRLLAGLSDLLSGSLTPNIALAIEAPVGRDFVRADPAQLELAVLNLVVNARDAMPEGGRISIGCRPSLPRETEGLPSGSGFVSIIVSDSGSGMDEATLRQAIEPFFTTKGADEGTGLGLSMIHGFAAQSGGALRLGSEVGRGTQAIIVLPSGSADAAASGAGPAASTCSGQRVLLVEDDEAVRAATEEMLTTLGHTVAAVGSVPLALAVLRDDDGFDAVITDFLMPGSSGRELVAALERSRPHLAVLIVSGYLGAVEEVPGHVPVLRKPFDVGELNDALCRAIATWRPPVLT